MRIIRTAEEVAAYGYALDGEFFEKNSLVIVEFLEGWPENDFVTEKEDGTYALEVEHRLPVYVSTAHSFTIFTIEVNRVLSQKTEMEVIVTDKVAEGDYPFHQ